MDKNTLLLVEKDYLPLQVSFFCSMVCLTNYLAPTSRWSRALAALGCLECLSSAAVKRQRLFCKQGILANN